MSTGCFTLWRTRNTHSNVGIPHLSPSTYPGRGTYASLVTPAQTSVVNSSAEQEASVPGYSLTPDDIREFQELIAKETGTQLSAQEAWDRTTELIALMRMLISPLSEDQQR